MIGHPEVEALRAVQADPLLSRSSPFIKFYGPIMVQQLFLSAPNAPLGATRVA